FYQELVEDQIQMVEATRKNLELHPDEPRFHRAFGQTLCWVGRAVEAIPHMHLAVDLAPENDLVRNELVIALCEAGRFSEALTEYQQARSHGSKSPYLFRGAGLAHLG